MPEDKRILKTRKVIISAFFTLLQKKDFSKITIKEISTVALISKSTFYDHYLDKYDLVEKIVARYSENFTRLIEQRFASIATHTTPKIMEQIIATISHDQDRINALFKVHLSNADLAANYSAILYQAALNYFKTSPKKYRFTNEFMAQLYAEFALASMRFSLHSPDSSRAQQVEIIYLLQKQLLQVL